MIINDISGVILAGGKSSRFGRNKALAEFQGVRLIERVVQVMRSLFQRLILITNTPEEYAFLGLPMHPDRIKGLGPLGGIYTGLQALQDQTGFFAACDMPFLSPELIQYMIRVRDDFNVVIPRHEAGLEILHAIYDKACLPAMEEIITRSKFRAIDFLEKVQVRYVTTEEIQSFDPGLRSFVNINRREDLERFF